MSVVNEGLLLKLTLVHESYIPCFYLNLHTTGATGGCVHVSKRLLGPLFQLPLAKYIPLLIALGVFSRVR